MDTYTRRPAKVKAVQIAQPKFIVTADGNEYFHPGDWLVVELNGDSHRCEDGIFKLKFVREQPPGGRDDPRGDERDI